MVASYIVYILPYDYSWLEFPERNFKDIEESQSVGQPIRSLNPLLEENTESKNQ